MQTHHPLFVQLNKPKPRYLSLH